MSNLSGSHPLLSSNIFVLLSHIILLGQNRYLLQTRGHVHVCLCYWTSGCEGPLYYPISSSSLLPYGSHQVYSPWEKEESETKGRQFSTSHNQLNQLRSVWVLLYCYESINTGANDGWSVTWFEARQTLFSNKTRWKWLKYISFNQFDNLPQAQIKLQALHFNKHTEKALISVYVNNSSINALFGPGLLI